MYHKQEDASQDILLSWEAGAVVMTSIPTVPTIYYPLVSSCKTSILKGQLFSIKPAEPSLLLAQESLGSCVKDALM